MLSAYKDKQNNNLCHSMPLLYLTLQHHIIMNDNINKYFVLMGLILASVFGFAAFVAIIFFLLKLFAATANTIPGSGSVFAFFVTTIPYFILFAAYYVVHKKISSGKNNGPSIVSRILLTIGSLVCIAQLIIAVLSYYNIKTNWIDAYDSYNKAWFALHLILILIASGILAAGDPREKNWLERDTKNPAADNNK